MRSDLVRQLNGSHMTKQEVVEMLGPPSYDTSSAKLHYDAFYGLGSSMPLTHGGYFPVYWTLVIRYQEGILDEAGVMRD